MSATTINYCQFSFSPWEGCTKISDGCTNCFAEQRDKRHLTEKVDHWGPGAPRRRTSAAYWRQPLKWNRDYRTALDSDSDIVPSRPRVLCPTLGDWLDPEVCSEWRSDLLCLIRATPNLTWMLLSKRPEGFAARLNRVAELDDFGSRIAREWIEGRPPANVWVGASVENQEMADKRIPELLAIPAAKRWLSVEPMLGPVDIHLFSHMGDPRQINPNYLRSECKISWVVCGGESGPGCRPMDPAWMRSLKDQCAAAGVPFWAKQLGGHPNPRHALVDLSADLRTRQLP